MRSITYKTDDEIVTMREAGRIVAQAHAAMKDALRPGISTKALDTIAETVIRDHGAIPAFLDYAPGGKPPFPATITSSVNNELVHGIPSDDVILKDGDIVSLDTACFHQGYVGDAAFSYAIGEVSIAVERLLQRCEEALYAAIEASIVGNNVSDVARATQKYASKHGYSVAREYTGHGVGQKMHEPPQVPNWWPRKKPRPGQQFWYDYTLKAGMTYAIEPMLIAGRNELYELDDQWTVVTKDGSLCAHFEHTILITDQGPEILTLP
ncbi:MAG: type I methionyl aminopeptidase [Phototrophicaceae bacterium]